jgi:hypothetical protein
MTAKKTYFVGKNFPRVAKRNDLAINTENGTVNYRGPNGWVSVGGSGGDANIADFVFSLNEDEGTTSSMTIANHDMVIETTRDDGQDADISITSADDIWITAGDEIEIDAEDTIDIRSGTDHVRIVSDRNNSSNEWTFETNGGLRFPDDSVQTTAFLGGDAGDFVVPTAFKDSEGDDLITFERTSTGTARIGTPQDDLSLRSARDITLIAGDDGPGNVYIGWGDATITPDASNRVATIGDVTAATGLGDITFDGVEIRGAGTASGDGLGAGTMQLVPDVDLYANDQYLIIDPTDPNHIHIRAGGAIDESIAKVILGGERNHVYVSDSDREVSIRTRPAIIENTYENINLTSSETFLTTTSSDISVGYTVNVDGTDYVVDVVNSNFPIEGQTSVTANGASFTAGASYVFTYEPTYENFWEFGSNGYLTGPAMGGLFVSGLLNGENDLWLGSSTNVVLSPGSESAAFVGDTNNPDNQIATLGDITVGTTGSFTTATHTITVTGGVITAITAL